MPSDATIADAFAATDLFASLDQRTIKRLATAAKKIEHAAGREITTQGEGAVGFHLILSGSATVTVNGEETGRIGPGDYFGEISLIDGKPRTATIVTDTDMTTAAITAWQFRPMLDEVPDLARALLLVMCERVRKAQAKAIVMAP